MPCSSPSAGGGLLFLFARPILNIFELKQHITDAAVTYLRIVSTGLPFIFSPAAFTGIYNAAGRSKDSVLHQRDGTDNEHRPRPSVHLRLRLGNSGRGTCHMAFRSYSIRHLRLQAPGEKRRARRFLLYRSAEKKYTRRIFKLGLPVATLNTLFAFVNMFLSRTASGREDTSD